MAAKFSVIGCGRVGINLAVCLSKAGYPPLGFFSRSVSSAQRALDSVKGEGRVFASPEDACREADIVFISTPDDVIERVTGSIAEKGGFSEESAVFHLSGALSSEILDRARDKGADTGSIHPLQSFTHYEEGDASPFLKINISVEGSRRAVLLGREVISALGATPFAIATEAKMLYHASAVVASNYLVTLESFALALLEKAGVPQDRGYEILEPLIRGTLNNIKNSGCVNALTGPVARGDIDIVTRHIRDLEDKAPQFTALYKLLGQYTLSIARQRGEISGDTAPEMETLFLS